MDDRPLRLLDRTPVEDDHKALLKRLVEAADARAEADGKELQYEFGKEHVACIIGCNQFLRLFRGGDGAGDIEVLVPDDTKKALRDEGIELREADGAVFRMFGWVRVDPTTLSDADAVIKQAYEKAA